MGIRQTLQLGMLFAMTACSDNPDPTLGVTGQSILSPCPTTPNCVCSDQATGPPAIEPLRFDAEPDAVWRSLIMHIDGQPRMKIIEQDQHYLRIESRTRLLRFVDDVEFHLRPAEQLVAMRSASRVGYSDLGANRKRLEAIRAALIAAGAIPPT